MGITRAATGDILHSSREFTSVFSCVLGQEITKHDKLFPYVTGDSRFSCCHHRYAIWHDSGTTW